MSRLEALYYPSWDPPPAWLKSYLLYSDKVRVIVPDDVDPEFHPANQALIDNAPELFEIHRYTQSDVNLDVDLSLLDNAFGAIAVTKSLSITRKVAVTVSPRGTASIPGYVFLHRSKFTNAIDDLLHQHHLCIDRLGKIAGNDYLVVQQDASSLVVGMIADHLGQRFGWQTITDRPFDFALNSYRRGADNTPDVCDRLASAIIEAETPRRIELFSTKQFLELREKFAPVREALRLAVTEIVELDRLVRIGDPEELRNRITVSAANFGVEVAKRRMCERSDQIKDLIPFTFGLVARVGGMIPLFTAKAGATGLGIAVATYEKLKPPKQICHRHSAQRLIAGLQRDILTKDVFRNLKIEHQDY